MPMRMTSTFTEAETLAQTQTRFQKCLESVTGLMANRPIDKAFQVRWAQQALGDCSLDNWFCPY